MTSVVLLTPDVSENCLGRSDTLARVLQPRFDVRIVGPQFGDGVWAPLRESAACPIQGVPMPRNGMSAGVAGWRRIRSRLADGDLIYVQKPFATSLWAARKSAAGRPVVLDIDDWETGFLEARQAAQSHANRVYRTLRDLRSLHHRATWNTRLGERLAHQIPHRSVSNTFLQRRFGGILVPHVRDTEVFDPSRFDTAKEQTRLGLDGFETVVMFFGTPRAHKGLSTLVDAVLRTPGCGLAIVGRDDSPAGQSYQRQLAQMAGDRVRLLGTQPFGEAPRVLAAADILAIPQSRGPVTDGQIPAKLFDAMAMAKAVVSTAVSDIPAWLDGCGRVTAPDDPQAMSGAIAELAADPELRRRLGMAARQRCIERASVVSARKTLLPLLESALHA